MGASRDRGCEAAGGRNLWACVVGPAEQSEGHYDDAIVTKRTRVTMWLVEALGGAGRGTRAGLRKLEERASGPGAVDRTKYGSTRASPKSYYVHHLQQISKAAVVYDAIAIRKQHRATRVRLCGGARPTTQPRMSLA